MAIFRWAFLFCLSILLLPAAPSFAQSSFDAPSSTQRFLDKPNSVLIGSLTVWQALDAYKTDETLDKGGREMWPVARHFCGSREGRVGYFWASYAVSIGSSYLLHRTGHRKLARLVLIAGNVSAASGFAYTLAHTR